MGEPDQGVLSPGLIDDLLTRDLPDCDLYMKWNWGDPPSSSLATRIVNAYFNDRSLIVIIHGDPRIGKSGYAFKVAIQVFNYLFGWTDLVRIYEATMGYHPLDVLRYWRSIKRSICPEPKFRTEKLPLYIWDDGGVYLFNQDYNKPEIKAIMKYLQIIFTKIQVIIITTPTPKVITAGIRAMPSAVWLQVIRDRGNDTVLDVLPDSERFSRRAKFYRPFMTPDLRRMKVWRGFKEDFDCRFPDPIFKHYGPIRDNYTRDLEDDIYTDALIKNKKSKELREKREKELIKVIPSIDYG